MAKLELSGRQEIGESRRWPPSTSPEPIFKASGTTRSDQVTVQIQRLIPDKPLGRRIDSLQLHHLSAEDHVDGLSQASVLNTQSGQCVEHQAWFSDPSQGSGTRSR